MTNQPAVNPVDVARIALKRLAERGLAPTPDNYAQFYNAILTIKAPEAKSSNEIQMAWEVLYSVNDILAAAQHAPDQGGAFARAIFGVCQRRAHA